ncbi:MFS transporter [Niveispirillum irakense]|uniref:MFS transporter n=1 Tax=Niveispirillum irakense TaxID=34011 RepID=UPI000400D1D2|nr:MFS transporter [Niveispirillum irakense]
MDRTQTGPDSAAYPSPATGWVTVAVLFALYILSLTDRYIIALLVEPMKRDLGLSDFQISLLQGPAFALLFCLCAIPVGVGLDRFSRRLVLYGAITLWSVAATACGLARGFGELFVARAGVGAGQSGFGTGSYSIIGDSFPPHRVSLAMSIFVMGGVMGAGIVFLLGGPIVAMAMAAGPVHLPLLGTVQPWQFVFIVTGLPGVVLALLVFLFKEPARRSRPAAIGYGPAIAFLRDHKRLYAAIFLGFGTTYAVTIGFQLWMPTYFIRIHGWAPAQVGMVLGVAQIVGAATLPLHGWVVDRMFKRGRRDAHLFWCVVTVLLAAPCAVASVLVPDAWVSVVLFTLFMACVLSTASMGPAITQVVTPPTLRGRVSALYVVVTGLIAMALGPAMVGFITDKLLGDERQVGLSLLLTVPLLLLPAVGMLASGRGAMLRRLGDHPA